MVHVFSCTSYKLQFINGEGRKKNWAKQQYKRVIFIESNSGSANQYMNFPRTRVCVYFFRFRDDLQMHDDKPHTHNKHILHTYSHTLKLSEKREWTENIIIHILWHNGKKCLIQNLKEKMKKKWQKKHALPFKMANKKKETIICDLKLAKSLSRLWIRSFFMIYLSYSYTLHTDTDTHTYHRKTEPFVGTSMPIKPKIYMFM